MKEPEQHEPTPKAPAIDELITSLFGIQRRSVIRAGRCAFCVKPNLNFRDERSKKEYRISGVCQKCQDQAFKPKD